VVHVPSAVCSDLSLAEKNAPNFVFQPGMLGAVSVRRVKAFAIEQAA